MKALMALSPARSAAHAKRRNSLGFARCCEPRFSSRHLRRRQLGDVRETFGDVSFRFSFTPHGTLHARSAANQERRSSTNSHPRESQHLSRKPAPNRNRTVAIRCPFGGIRQGARPSRQTRHRSPTKRSICRTNDVSATHGSGRVRRRSGLGQGRMARSTPAHTANTTRRPPTNPVSTEQRTSQHRTATVR